MGRVVKLLTGSDNKTRCVRLRRSDSTEEVYSVNHLYPLELSLMTNGARDEVRNVPSTPRKVPQRRDAIKCRQRLKLSQ